MTTIDLYKPATLTIADRDLTPPQPRADYLTLEECIARYPRITRALTMAGFTLTEAGAALRDYRAGNLWSGEAINYTGGTVKAIRSATTDWQRHMAARTMHRGGWTDQLIARYQRENPRHVVALRQAWAIAQTDRERLAPAYRQEPSAAWHAANERCQEANAAYYAARAALTSTPEAAQ